MNRSINGRLGSCANTRKTDYIIVSAKSGALQLNRSDLTGTAGQLTPQMSPNGMGKLKCTGWPDPAELRARLSNAVPIAKAFGFAPSAF